MADTEIHLTAIAIAIAIAMTLSSPLLTCLNCFYGILSSHFVIYLIATPNCDIEPPTAVNIRSGRERQQTSILYPMDTGLAKSTIPSQPFL
ncbi:hypothetical protein F4811DRAFT_508362 [Daldinia bambusicola]|nr:hypothetical protein F4811DRAFT_508362 [Daldinia bambusicola]